MSNQKDSFVVGLHVLQVGQVELNEEKKKEKEKVPFKGNLFRLMCHPATLLSPQLTAGFQHICSSVFTNTQVK